MNSTASFVVSKVEIAGIPAGTKLLTAVGGQKFLKHGDKVVFINDRDLTDTFFEEVPTIADFDNSGNFNVLERLCAALVNDCVLCDDCSDNEPEAPAPIDVPPSYNLEAIFDSQTFHKLLDAAENQKAIAEGDQYFFYSTKEKRWAKAKMERTSSDIGRLVAGFALPITTTNRSKYNRLVKLNDVYGLGLSKEEIHSISDY